MENSESFEYERKTVLSKKMNLVELSPDVPGVWTALWRVSEN